MVLDVEKLEYLKNDKIMMKNLKKLIKIGPWDHLSNSGFCIS